jgi:hypothetical protein
LRFGVSEMLKACCGWKYSQERVEDKRWKELDEIAYHLSQGLLLANDYREAHIVSAAQAYLAIMSLVQVGECGFMSRLLV